MIQRSHLQLSLERFLAARTYYPCCVLTHPDIRQLQEAAHIVRDLYPWPVLSPGAVLSAALLSVAPRQRAHTAHTALLAAIRPFAPGPLLCVDIDVLFEPSLQLDPLRLLRDVSRIATIIVLWPGATLHGALSYAVPTHRHYRSWSSTDLSAESLVSLQINEVIYALP